MKLTIELYNYNYSVECDREDFNGEELKQMFTRLLVCAGYPTSLIEFGDEE